MPYQTIRRTTHPYPFDLSLSKAVVAPTAERATWFDRLTTNGGG